MLTVKQLIAGSGKFWAEKPSEYLSSVEVLAWHAAAELASFVELTIEPQNLPKVAPGTWMVLWGLDAWCKDVGELPSQSHALVMLIAERVNRGLSPRGDDTTKAERR